MTVINITITLMFFLLFVILGLVIFAYWGSHKSHEQTHSKMDNIHADVLTNKDTLDKTHDAVMSFVNKIQKIHSDRS